MKLTHADIVVKRTMLGNPTISSSRLLVLAQILLRDPYAYWGEDGCAHVHGIKETNPRKAILKLPEHLLKPMDIDPELQKAIPDFYAARHVERELELHQFAFIEKHIDSLAKYTLSHQKEFDTDKLSSTSDKALIFSIPANIEASWKAAATELVDAIVAGLMQTKYISKGISSTHKKDPMDLMSWKGGYWFAMYQKFKAIQDSLKTPISDQAVADISAIWNSVMISNP